MNKRLSIKLVKWQKYFYPLAALLFAVLSPPLAADDISGADKYAWSENTGWFNFKSTHEPVTVHDDHLEGYVWAENVGWIRLGTFVGGGSHTYTNNSATNYGVNNDGSGNLSGYGWGENIGWVNFNPSNSQVSIDAGTGDFSGFAWAENIGWIHFQNSSPAYKVQRVIPPGGPGGGNNIQPIPTLSFWALLILAALMALQGGRLASERLARHPTS
ncbi:MAG: hypothetical protein GQ532_01030 [Methylomarinum sp.]|nr:hypothetical protein [Methylomarinum sp.]